jgi:hypothetical protein
MQGPYGEDAEVAPIFTRTRSYVIVSGLAGYRSVRP